jgi:hypothetical protein
MDSMNDLAEQHILESASRLRHIDAMAARTRIAAAKDEKAAETDALLGQIEQDRDRFAQELQAIRRLPRGEGSDRITRGEGVKGLLESVARQLEQLLMAVLERNR